MREYILEKQPPYAVKTASLHLCIDSTTLLEGCNTILPKNVCSCSYTYCISWDLYLWSDYLRCLDGTWHISCNRSIACLPGVISKLLPPFDCKVFQTRARQDKNTPFKLYDTIWSSNNILTQCRPNKSQCERKQKSTRDVVEVELPAEEVWILLAVRLVGGDYHSYSGSGCFSPLLYCRGVIKQSTERSSMTNPWRACKLKLWHLKRDSRSRGQWEEIEKRE